MSIRGFKRQKSNQPPQYSFSQVPRAEIPRSNFNRSHSYKTAFDSGYLVPIYVDEALPGDTFNCKLTSVGRLATPIVPFVDNLHLDFFFFAVPLRLIWDNFQKFMGEQTDPGDSTDYTVPVITADAGTGFTVGSLADYMGLPIGINSLEVNSLHFRAYNLIWNEWFRSEDLQDSAVVDKDDGPDTITDYVLLKRGKRHDYFTSCLPWAQKGDAIELPLGSEAKVHTAANAGGVINVYSDAAGAARDLYEPTPTGADQIEVHTTLTTAANYLYSDLSSATASTINELREAFQLQKLLERDARGGTRYTEIVRSHFRVDSPDARLQRPEYLGGGKSMINITPIPQTSESGTTKQGTLAAVGYQSASGIGFTKSFVEHSVIIGLACCYADLTYQQGLRRMWSRQTKYDYYWPALAHLGEQAVLNKEIYCQNDANDDLVFGYQEAWADMRYFPSQITGILRSQAASSLDYWHLAQEFSSLPALNATFIAETPPVSRVVAVPSEPEIIFDGYFDLICTRPMPTYSVPGLIDHF